MSLQGRRAQDVTADDVRDLVKAGAAAGQAIEFKREMTDIEKILKQICGMCNGGVGISSKDDLIGSDVGPIPVEKFDPDSTAYELVKQIYEDFGFTADLIPPSQFDDEHRFVPWPDQEA